MALRIAQKEKPRFAPLLRRAARSVCVSGQPLNRCNLHPIAVPASGDPALWHTLCQVILDTVVPAIYARRKHSFFGRATLRPELYMYRNTDHAQEPITVKRSTLITHALPATTTQSCTKQKSRQRTYSTVQFVSTFSTFSSLESRTRNLRPTVLWWTKLCRHVASA